MAGEKGDFKGMSMTGNHMEADGSKIQNSVLIVVQKGLTGTHHQRHISPKEGN